MQRATANRGLVPLLLLLPEPDAGGADPLGALFPDPTTSYARERADHARAALDLAWPATEGALVDAYVKHQMGHAPDLA